MNRLLNNLCGSLCQLNNNDKILILGCGISDHITSKIENQIIPLLYMLNLKNLTLSDINISKDISNFRYNLNELNYKYNINLENILPNYYYNTIENFKYLNCLWDLDISERFLKFDLLKDDINNIDNYDFIQLKQILHLKEFKYDRLNIINKLYNKLNNNGNLYITIYSKLNKFYLSNYYDSYTCLTSVELDILKNTYNNIIIEKSTLLEGIMKGNEYYKILIPRTII